MAEKLPTPTIGEFPHQPPTAFKFPARDFGKKKRSFQPQWFQKWKWLHYDESDDHAYCHTCIKAYQGNHLSSSHVEPSFISKGYSNWKNATENFRCHESSRGHKDAVLKTQTLPHTTKDIGESLSQAHAQEKKERRQCFMKILANTRFLARQGLALRGDGDEQDSNYIQLLKLRGQDDSRIQDWLLKKVNKYTAPSVQNEMVKTMALEILRDIADSVRQSPFFSIMADETTDASNKEQVVICLRHVDNDLEVHEDFVGLYKVENIEANTLVPVLLDVLQRLNLSIHDVRGQCYDGASSMSGSKGGVAKQLCDREPRALYMHCYGHALNLACNDSIRQCKLMRDALDSSQEIIKLVKFSPRRDSIFQAIKKNLSPDTPGVRVLCPTRWTVKADSLLSILDNYPALNELWSEALDYVKDTETRSRIRGVAAHMANFKFFFGASLAETILRHCDNLSKTLQHTEMSAAEGQSIAALSLQCLKNLRTDEMFSLFWCKVTERAKKLELEEPSLPRPRKVPRLFEVGCSQSTHPASVEDYYRQIYFEALDLITNSISDRFDQHGYRIYSQVEQLLLKAAKKEAYDEELSFVTKFYGSDFDARILKVHLELLSACDIPPPRCFTDVLAYLKDCSPAKRALFSEVVTLAKLVLVMPATNASSERSFSALRRIKTYLRATMRQDRLVYLMLLHIHKDFTDKLDLINIANLFVSGSEHRETLFGKFTSSDL